jgi:hypothetical protein
MRNLLKLFENRLLLEAEDYKPMFEPLDRIIASMAENTSLPIYNFTDPINACKAYVAPQRKDKQMWVSRVLRAYVASMNAAYLGTMPGQEEYANLFADLAKKYVEQAAGPGNSLLLPIRSFRQFIEKMEHYDGVNYGKVKNFSYNSRQTEQDVLTALKTLEDEYIERAQGMLTPQPDDQVIVDLNPYFWFKLNRASCPDEAKAMGQCGNSPAARTQQRILSLRLFKDKIDGVRYYEPCLTFILHEDGYLGEMKGKGNLKPAKHYHDQIEALLHLPMIKGLRGGGYLEQNNFALADLGDERARANTDRKQELLSLKDQYKQYGFSPEFEARLVDGYKTQGKNFWRVQKFDPKTELANHDLDALYNDNPILMPAKEYYKRRGLDADFLSLLGKNLDWDNPERARYEREEMFFLADLSPEDQQKLFAAYPGTMPVKAYYEKFGLNDELMQRIQDGIEAHASQSYYNNGQGWYNRQSGETEGFTAESLSVEDRHKLWRKFPDTATPADLYHMDGLSDKIIDEMDAGYENEGFEFFNTYGLSPTDLSPEDQVSLLASHPNLASAKVRLENFGPTERFAQSAIHDCENANHQASFSPTWDEDKKLFEMQKFESAHDLMTEYGDDNLKEYGAEDFYPDFDGESDESAVDDFDDHLPIQTQALLYDRARSYLSNDAADDSNDDEDEDDDDYYNDDDDSTESVDSWKDVVSVLKQNDDINYDAMLSATSHGASSGAESEAFEAVDKALTGIEVSLGKILFTEGTTSDGSKYVDRHAACAWVLSPEEMVKFIDGGPLKDAEWGDLKDVLDDQEIKMSVPYYGFSGYDGDAAADHFYEECDLDINFAPNPYTKAVRATMSEDALRAAIKEVYDLIPQGMMYKPNLKEFENLTADRLREKLEYVCQKYYAKMGSA